MDLPLVYGDTVECAQETLTNRMNVKFLVCGAPFVNHHTMLNNQDGSRTDFPGIRPCLRKLLGGPSHRFRTCALLPLLTGIDSTCSCDGRLSTQERANAAYQQKK